MHKDHTQKPRCDICNLMHRTIGEYRLIVAFTFWPLHFLTVPPPKFSFASAPTLAYRPIDI